MWAADEQKGRFLRRRNSLVSLRILLRRTSSGSASLLILAFQSTLATGCYAKADQCSLPVAVVFASPPERVNAISIILNSLPVFG